MKTIELVRQGLTAGGFGGLYYPSTPCRCLAEDLAPCDNMPVGCVAGYKHTHSSGKWIIADQKEPLSDDDIGKILDDY